MDTKVKATHEAPSVKGLPIVGNMFTFRKDPVETLYTAWKEAGDIFNYNIGPLSFCVISDPELVQEVLIEQKQIFQRPRNVKGGTILTYLLGQSILTTDGELWLTKRRMMQPIFHKQHIQEMGKTMAEAGAQMLERWESLPNGATFNLAEQTRMVTLDIINRTMFGVDVLPEIDRVGDIVDIGLHYIAKRTRSFIKIPESWPTPENRRFQRSRAILDEYLYKIIRDRRNSDQHPGDLLDMLLAARDEQTGEVMNDEQVRNEVATIYGAGHETTAVALTWAWYALNQHPEVLQKLQDEIDRVLQGRLPLASDLPDIPYATAVFEETLRIFPPVPMTVRVACQDTTVDGYDFPRGTMAMAAIYNIHNHPDYWQEPIQFMPERFLPGNRARLDRHAYIPFLTGPHLCIGNSFALLEGPLLLAMMAQKYSLQMVPGQTIERDVAVTMRPKYGFKVQLIRRGS